MRSQFDWSPYLNRLYQGEARETVCQAMLMAEIASMNAPTLLDIGCGRGFFSIPSLQTELAGSAGHIIGIEPDKLIPIQPIFSEIYHTSFEDAPIPPASLDMAFAVMVLEHLPDPTSFWEKLHLVLKPGGIFWGFTVDARHWFVAGSMLTERLRLKEFYLNRLHGKRGAARYENYPVYYRNNTPRQFIRSAASFSEVTVQSLYLRGQIDFYLPKGMRWIGRTLDAAYWRLGHIGSNIAVRVVR